MQCDHDRAAEGMEMRARGGDIAISWWFGTLLVVLAAGAFAQVTPDPVLSPGAVRPDPALSPDQTQSAPVLMPGATPGDRALSPEQSQGAPVLRPGGVPADSASMPDQTRPDPVRSPTPDGSLAPLPPIFPRQN
jgi:hypothetical protein